MTGHDPLSTIQDGVAALRADIDEIDTRLIVLLNHRARLALRIGRAKRAKGLGIKDRGREAEIIGALLSKNEGPLSDKDVVELWTTIIAQSRRLQASQRA